MNKNRQNILRETSSDQISEQKPASTRQNKIKLNQTQQIESSHDLYSPVAQQPKSKSRKSSAKKGSKSRSRSKSKKRQNPQELFLKQIDSLPEFKGPLLATSGMAKHYEKTTKAIVDAQLDPTLFESNCYYRPKITKKSEELAEQGRQRLQQKYLMVTAQSMFSNSIQVISSQ